MRRQIARALIIIGAAMLALGRKLETPAPPPAAKLTIDLNHRWYRPAAHRRRFAWSRLVPMPALAFG